MKDDIRYPIGTFMMPSQLTAQERIDAVSQVANLPENLQEVIEDLDAERLDTPYREGGWTVRQVVHHLADSHINGFVRFKKGLTEDLPTVGLYHQDRWAQTPETNLPPGVSLTLLRALHQRWATLIRSFTDDDWKRQVAHPEWGKITLEQMLALYAWHGRHHVAHIRRLRESRGW